MKNKKKIDKINDFISEIDWAFGLNTYSKTITILNEDVEAGQGYSKRLFVIYRTDYQDIEIGIYPIFFKDPPESQRESLIHELCHSITHPISEAAYDLHNGKLITPEQIREKNEEATSKIQNLITRLLEGRNKYMNSAYKSYLEKKKKKPKKKENKKKVKKHK